MSGRTSRAWVEVDLAAILANARTIARVAGVRLLPVVKANAYGLGAVAVSGALEALEPWGYGVATVDEGIELRLAGTQRRILVFLPARAELLDAYAEHRLTPVLEDETTVRAWVARRAGPFHLEVDTGMSRTGVRWDRIAAVAPVLDTPALEGVFTQFHSADRSPGTMAEQMERFGIAVAGLPRQPPVRHVANSAAALHGRRFALDLVRPGLFLYGGRPGAHGPAPAPVVSLRARVVSVRRVARGETVSYGASWTAPGDTTVATLAIGYADGLRRTLGQSGRAHALIRERPCPIVGHVTMDLTMVDAGGGPVEVGDSATLLGADGGCRITLEDIAAWSGTIPYEILTGLGPRLPRVYA
ncbi:MAG TPA: alanine racemase [Gemmatimonadales bacterium]|nr:alanine racemase [Gemmatimonadales bacterium]